MTRRCKQRLTGQLSFTRHCVCWRFQQRYRWQIWNDLSNGPIWCVCSASLWSLGGSRIGWQFVETSSAVIRAGPNSELKYWLPVSSWVWISIYLSGCLSIHLPIHPSTIHPSIYPSSYEPVHLSIYLSVRPSIHPITYLPTCLFVISINFESSGLVSK